MIRVRYRSAVILGGIAMRKFLSLVLAIMMVASLAVVGVSAADNDTATVTITGFNNESSDTKTYKVGETFTAYVYLNASGLNTNGMIGALKCNQYYTNSVLALADAYDEKDGGMIVDLDGMFPITGDSTVANGMLADHISFNASKPSMNNAFKFNSDDSALIISHYTVTKAGTANITTDLVTLAISDMYLTKAVHKSQIYDDNFKVYVKLSDPETAGGSTVSGTITSFNDKTEEIEDITVELLQGEDVKYTTTVNGNVVDYSIAGVADGNYILRFSKKNHVTRDYALVISGDTTADAEIRLIGDVSGDGVVNTTDGMRVNMATKGHLELDEYLFKVADVSGDELVNTTDFMRINNHAKNILSLWK